MPTWLGYHGRMSRLMVSWAIQRPTEASTGKHRSCYTQAIELIISIPKPQRVQASCRSILTARPLFTSGCYPGRSGVFFIIKKRIMRMNDTAMPVGTIRSQAPGNKNLTICLNSDIDRLIQSLQDTVCNTNFPESTVVFKPAFTFENSTLLRRNLVNSIYSVHFNVTNYGQHIHVVRETTQNRETMNTTQHLMDQLPYSATIPECRPSQINPNARNYPGKSSCEFRPELLRLLSY